jgi:hypothetical protein
VASIVGPVGRGAAGLGGAQVARGVREPQELFTLPE